MKSNLHKIYRDICKGFSPTRWDGQNVYIKHLDNFDQGEIDAYYELQLEKAVRLGVPTQESKQKWLIDNGLWSGKEEIDLREQKDYIENMEKTKKKLFLRSQIDQHAKVLETETTRYYEMLGKKNKLFGLTAEFHASQKMQFYYLYVSFFKDDGLRFRLFSVEDLNELSEDESFGLLNLYVEELAAFGIPTVKKIALAGFFMNQLHLCNDRVSDFFGLPISRLTVNQSNLLSYGLYFKNLMQNEQIPKDILDEPEKIEEFVQRSHAAKDALSKTKMEGGSTAIVGATRQDLKEMGGREESAIMKQAMKQGVSTINDVINMTGV